MINLIDAKNELMSKKTKLKITIEEFNTFFADYISHKIHVISDSDFSNLVSKYEDELL